MLHANCPEKSQTPRVSSLEDFLNHAASAQTVYIGEDNHLDRKHIYAQINLIKGFAATNDNLILAWELFPWFVHDEFSKIADAGEDPSKEGMRAEAYGALSKCFSGDFYAARKLIQEVSRFSEKVRIVPIGPVCKHNSKTRQQVSEALAEQIDMLKGKVVAILGETRITSERGNESSVPYILDSNPKRKRKASDSVALLQFTQPEEEIRSRYPYTGVIFAPEENSADRITTYRLRLV